jgi:hypothetical protein
MDAIGRAETDRLRRGTAQNPARDDEPGCLKARLSIASSHQDVAL